MARVSLTERQLSAIIGQAGLEHSQITLIGRWIARGDGCAVYRDETGNRRFVSFGGRYADLRMRMPPRRLPTDPRFSLEGSYPAYV